MKKFFLPFLLVAGLAVHAAPKKIAAVLTLGKDGQLVYGVDEQGNRVPDFSTCGYAADEQPIPAVPVRIVVAPIPGDETALIQKAIDTVSALPADARGLRGAVLLLRGRHEVSGSLYLTVSGVVLRGQGMDENGTVLVAAGTSRRTLIRILGKNDLTVHPNADWQVADDYVPVGATSFHVKNGAALKVGDSIRVIRPSTKAWIETLGMNEFGGGLGDWRLVWHPGEFDLAWNRTIRAVATNLITLDAPITTALETKFGGGHVETFSWPGRITNVGVENIRLESAFAAGHPLDEEHAWFALTMENAADVWTRQVTFEHFSGSAVAVYETCQRVTVQDCLSLAPVSENGGWRRNTFLTLGQQTLFLRCCSEQGRHDFCTGDGAAGPNAFVQCEDAQPLGDSGALGSWASGTLYDNVRIDGAGLNLMDRGPAGEGAGWSAANCLLWQCDASQIACQSPPTARNWAIGCWGEFSGNGIWRSANESLKPASLFVAQIAERLGDDAADRFPLMQRSTEEYSNPSAAQAAQLIAASHQPAPQLADFIRQASQRDPIPSDPGTAPTVDYPAGSRLVAPVLHPLSLTNGWLVCDGQLLNGTVGSVNWWRGNMRPGDAKNYGVNLTRFAPGREGAGLTDDLTELVHEMVGHHEVAFDHHYGLWYDRRREDHERVRRIDGDVWAPFYEQPFARSGQGTAWDGLSKYDLTKYNVWYWSRLQTFADLCGQHGLVLFNENYFQHNVIEAGAHWVDCPWRSANNINGTGFPEPPPFAGDKRIFMADQFYDPTQPVRRQLHADFIRQNLNNFTNEPNVIQFTSAEFTGPLAFEQFWLDTVGQWEHETGRHPLIALATPKNVQDAILADPARAAVVDVICFRYWWRTQDDTFAPAGGQSLSPRQFERKWKGGTPSDEDLAQMVTEYRAQNPAKAILTSGEDEALVGGWAYLCAGGSLPNLPSSTDARLLTAIPRMTAWQADAAKGLWVLREPGQQMLLYSSSEDPAILDLSSETGIYHVHTVNTRSGQVNRKSNTITAGGKVSIPAGLSWLTRD